jgi:hypothetical protein
MTRTLHIVILLCLALLPATALCQQSDFAVKKDFEERHERLMRLIETATSTAQLDSLKNGIEGLALDFSQHAAFLDKALYPATFEQKMKDLRDLHARVYDATRVMETQGTQIIAMETTIKDLTYSLDTLAKERDVLFAELQRNKADITALRETVKRLQAYMAAKDQLLFALVDSMFMPYGRDLANVGDDLRDDLTTKIEKANVLTRVYDIASDNVRFLTATEFQGKDFGPLLDNYQQFSARWKGLSDKMHAVYLTGQTADAKGMAAKRGTSVKTPAIPVVRVDSLLTEWNTALRRTFWSTIEKEFAVRGVAISPFADAPGFSASIRAYVDQVKNSGEDASVFVEDVWKARIDTEWKDALTRESVLGKEEYAALDSMVKELTPPMVDMKYILYIGIIVIVALVLWWLLARKPKQPAAKPPVAQR